MFSIKITIDRSGDTTLFERASRRLRNPRDMMRKIGVLIMSSAVRRLENVLRKDSDAIRSGRPAASLRVSPQGQGSGDTIFSLSDTEVEVGSNLPYAAQVHFGGTIFPKGNALAIPMDPRLRRLGISPRELPDDQIKRLFFRPSKSGKPNVIGVLLLAPKSKRGKVKLLYTLALLVRQRPRPFLFVDEEDQQVMREAIFPAHLGLTNN